MKKTLITLSLIAAVLAVCLPLLAHHGNAAYESNLTEVKNAIVTRLVWANPHTLVLFDAPDEKGEVVHWNAEMGSPSALANVGWNKASLTAGDKIGFHPPGKNEKPRRPHSVHRARRWQQVNG